MINKNTTKKPSFTVSDLEKAVAETAQSIPERKEKEARAKQVSDLINDSDTKKLADKQRAFENKHLFPEKYPPYPAQMLAEKAEEEEEHAKRGEMALRGYYHHINDVDKAAKEEFGMEFHSYLPLTRRADALDEMRKNKIRKDEAELTASLHPDPSLTLPPAHRMPDEKELGVIADLRLQKAMAKARRKSNENEALNKQVAERDREIKELQDRLKTKSTHQKTTERRLFRKSKKAKNLSNALQPFRFPLSKSIVEKLLAVDQTISEFLLDLGNAEYVITKENIVSTAARRLMKVRAIDEPEMLQDEDGRVVSRWADILDRVEKPWKYDNG